MQIHDILMATDFSECAERAQETAFDVAERFGAKIHLFHALEIPFPIFEPYSVAVPERFMAEARKGAAEKLDTALGAAHARGLEGTTALGEVPAVFEISERASRLGADLIVVGTEGHTGLKHLVLGSVAEGTVRTAPCSVLTARGPLGEGTGPVVVGTDFSANARAALRDACAIADVLEADLHLVHSAATAPPLVLPYEIAVPPDFCDAVIGDANKRIAEAASSCSIRGRVTTEVSTAPPQVALPEIAGRLGARLVVVGSRGLTGLKHLLLGSVAERTVRHAPCGVWTVRSAE